MFLGRVIDLLFQNVQVNLIVNSAYPCYLLPWWIIFLYYLRSFYICYFISIYLFLPFSPCMETKERLNKNITINWTSMYLATIYSIVGGLLKRHRDSVLMWLDKEPMATIKYMMTLVISSLTMSSFQKVWSVFYDWDIFW